jgi:CheY-like chemotaxis protein
MSFHEFAIVSIEQGRKRTSHHWPEKTNQTAKWFHCSLFAKSVAPGIPAKDAFKKIRPRALWSHFCITYCRAIPAGTEFFGSRRLMLLLGQSVMQLTMPSSSVKTHAKTGAGGRGMARVLVVDSCADTSRSLAILLRCWGHEVREAADGQAALATARVFRPDVILTEIVLPGMDGYEFARQLRPQEGMNQVILAAITTLGDEKYRRQAHEAGFDSYFVKPADPEILRTLLPVQTAPSIQRSEVRGQRSEVRNSPWPSDF